MISKWRHKVFELMVQLKTQEILCNDINSKHKVQMDNAKAELKR